MKMFSVYLAWFAMAGVLVAGIILASRGNLWLFAIGMLAFMAAFVKFGCLSH
jgi:1,4-dihydroxy-2-naphthoate octaprenyltransferase